MRFRMFNFFILETARQDDDTGMNFTNAHQLAYALMKSTKALRARGIWWRLA